MTCLSGCAQWAVCRINQTYLTHYCVIRADLPIGVQAAQLIHAAGYSSPGSLPEGTYAVALTVPNEAALRSLADDLERAGLPRHLIIESDPPYTGQAMALGIAPMDRKHLKKHLSKYPLLRGVRSADLAGSTPAATPNALVASVRPEHQE